MRALCFNRTFFFQNGLLLCLLKDVVSDVVHGKKVSQAPQFKRIINGEMAEVGQFPWLVAVLRGADGTERSYYDNQFCGGALIGAQWILTAAHCVDDILSDNLSVLIGSTSLSTWFEQRFVYNGMEYEAEWRDVIEIFNHPISDLSLLKISQPSTLPQIRYATTLVPPGTMAQNMGWGDTNMADYITDSPEDLYYISLPIVDDETCEQRLANFNKALSADREEVCAGYEDAGFAPCQGDSGGPLIVESQDDGEWEVVGVVSWGPGCGDDGTVDVYADVAALAPFIDTVVNSVDGMSYFDQVQCSSPSVATFNDIDNAQDCWASCRDDYGIDMIAAVGFDAEDASCQCYEHCLCTVESRESYSLIIQSGSLVPGSCDDTEMFINYWCDSSLDVFVGYFSSASDCWDECYSDYADTLQAIDFHPSASGMCFCQDNCSCLHLVRGTNLIARDPRQFPALCAPTEPDDDDEEQTDDIDTDNDDAYYYSGEIDDEALEVSEALRLVDQNVWCHSDLDVNPAANMQVQSAQDCWDLCNSMFDTIVAIDWHPWGTCFCQDGCDCLLSSFSAKLVVASDFPLPRSCDGSTSSEPTLNPTPSPSVSTSECRDSDFWFKKDEPSKNCDWVAELDDKRRCGVTGDNGLRAYQECHLACNTCPNNCESDDSTTWSRSGDTTKDCAWVSTSYPARCTRANDDGVYGFETEACQHACRICSFCDDDATWSINNQPSKDCSWVATASQSRCTKRGTYANETWTYAFEACPSACRVCPNYGDCSDDPGWLKNNEDDNSEKNCDWVADAPFAADDGSGPARCIIKGTDSTGGSAYAFEACRFACSTC